jgi:hypothetical protein
MVWLLVRVRVYGSKNRIDLELELELELEGVHKKSDFFPLRKKGANSG